MCGEHEYHHKTAMSFTVAKYYIAHCMASMETHDSANSFRVARYCVAQGVMNIGTMHQIDIAV